MAFESLTDKLQNVFRNLRSKGRLTESDVKDALREVRIALLEADVSYKVVKNFIKTVQERAVGQDVLNGLNPGQMVVKIVNEELIRLMGSETTELPLLPPSEITVLMMAGLQGAGKTTTAAKLAGQLKAKGRRPLLAACDVYRPAAVKQLQINGEKQGVEVYAEENSKDPVSIAADSIEYAKKNGFNVVILDTAGRLHIDDGMMQELKNIKEAVPVSQTILVVDAMTGQDAVNAASAFNDQVGIDGVILTKLDGDTRGGAALSIRAVTGKPILYVGMGEKLTDLQQFYPDRMASRILGMGDIMSLIEKAQAEVDQDKAKAMEEKIRKASFDLNDYLDQMQQVKKMGGVGEIMKMLPGMGMNLKKADMPDEDVTAAQMARTEAIIRSMTVKERYNPEIINTSRKIRIAKGSGVEVADVSRLLKQFDQSRKLMKQLQGMGRNGRKGRFRLPF
ncbi:MAG: signal recognition particle protein [Lachnospiraceae bacterium]